MLLDVNGCGTHACYLEEGNNPGMYSLEELKEQLEYGELLYAIDIDDFESDIREDILDKIYSESFDMLMASNTHTTTLQRHHSLCKVMCYSFLVLEYLHAYIINV